MSTFPLIAGSRWGSYLATRITRQNMIRSISSHHPIQPHRYCSTSSSHSSTLPLITPNLSATNRRVLFSSSTDARSTRISNPPIPDDLDLPTITPPSTMSSTSTTTISTALPNTIPSSPPPKRHIHTSRCRHIPKTFESITTPIYRDIDSVDFDTIHDHVIHTVAKGGSPIDNMMAANTAYAAAYTAAGNNKLPVRPGKKLAVVTCMDSRIDVFKCFGLRHGDAHVIRNAGGRISEALRSVIISQNLLGTEEVAIIHHTDCGIMLYNDIQMKEQIIQQRGGDDPTLRKEVAKQVQPMKMLSFRGRPEESVLEDLRFFNSSPLVKHKIKARAFTFAVETGKLTEVFDDVEQFDDHFKLNDEVN